MLHILCKILTQSNVIPSFSSKDQDTCKWGNLETKNRKGGFLCPRCKSKGHGQIDCCALVKTKEKVSCGTRVGSKTKKRRSKGSQLESLLTKLSRSKKWKEHEVNTQKGWKIKQGITRNGTRKVNQKNTKVFKTLMMTKYLIVSFKT